MELALVDGVIPVIRRTAWFNPAYSPIGVNWHRELIVETLRHPGVLRIVPWRLLVARSSA
jgi:hypothetical protein